MKPSREIRNISRSVHQRLLNRARNDVVDFNLLLQRYAIERFLYRLGLSTQVDRFMLKGATLFLVWSGKQLRPTRDVDLLGAGPRDHEAIRQAMEEICSIPCPEDGVVFEGENMRIDDIRGEQQYGGVRVILRGTLGRARLTLQVDVGFGDAVTPEPEEREYPTLLDHPAPRLWMYPRETYVAEKLEAMVKLGSFNSRVNDLWDLATLAQYFDFNGESLCDAIGETFRQRGTKFGDRRPVALQPEFYEDSMRAKYWQAFQRQVGEGSIGDMLLTDVGEDIRRFLGPLYDSLKANESFTMFWPAGGPWQPGVYKRDGGEGNV